MTFEVVFSITGAVDCSANDEWFTFDDVSSFVSPTSIESIGLSANAFRASSSAIRSFRFSSSIFSFFFSAAMVVVARKDNEGSCRLWTGVARVGLGDILSPSVVPLLLFLKVTPGAQVDKKESMSGSYKSWLFGSSSMNTLNFCGRSRRLFVLFLVGSMFVVEDDIPLYAVSR
jgi:hypothetical protein